MTARLPPITITLNVPGQRGLDPPARPRGGATDGHCTHEQTLLCDGLVMDDVIECPMHNGRFDYTTGRALGAPVLTDLRCYPVRVEDGTVYLDLG